MIETGTNSVHHVMVELFMLDDVGQAYDLALGGIQGASRRRSDGTPTIS